MRHSLYLLLFLLISISCKSQEIVINKAVPPDTFNVKIIVAGDVMGHMPQVNSAWVDSLKTYDYTPVFEYVKKYLSSADLAIANLEVPLAGKPYSGYPQFSSPDELGTCLKEVGFDALIMANNHAVDRGKKGVLHTLYVLDSLNIPHTGVFKDTADRNKKYPLFIVVNRVKIALLNYTYGTNGIRPEKPIVVNYIDTAAIRKDIEKCRKNKADLILATVHWGTEYERFTIKDQRVVANFFARNGVHVIVGSHPHVVEPFDILYPFNNDSSYQVPVLYSTGNFYSNQRDRYKDGGVILEINIQKVHQSRIISVGYVPVWVYKGWYNNKIIYRLIPSSKIKEAQLKFGINSADSVKCAEFFDDTRKHLGNLKEIPVTD